MAYSSGKRWVAEATCLKRSVSGWYRSHRAVQCGVSPKRGNKHGKLSGKNSWKCWLVWRMALCTQAPLSFWLLPVWNDKRENSFRWKIEAQFGEKLWCSYPFGLCVLILNWSNNSKYVLGKDWPYSSKPKLAPVLGNNLVWFLRTISHGCWGNLSLIWRKSVTDFEKICPRVWGNPSPILGTSATDQICGQALGAAS